MKHPVRLALDAPSLAGVHVAKPGQALVEVLLADADLVGKPAAVCGSDLVHSPHLSESLGICKRFASQQSPLAPSCSLDLPDNRGMETASDRRLRKLRELCDANGGPKAVGKAAGVSGDGLDQVLKGVLLPAKQDGTRSPRTLGDATARKIEAAYRKPRGWFDTEDGAPAVASLPFRDLDPFEVQLVTFFRQMSHDERHELLIQLNNQRTTTETVPSVANPWVDSGRRIKDIGHTPERRAPRVVNR